MKIIIKYNNNFTCLYVKKMLLRNLLAEKIIDC